jgi:hypothetical protein
VRRCLLPVCGILPFRTSLTVRWENLTCLVGAIRWHCFLVPGQGTLCSKHGTVAKYAAGKRTLEPCKHDREHAANT